MQDRFVLRFFSLKAETRTLPPAYIWEGVTDRMEFNYAFNISIRAIEKYIRTLIINKFTVKLKIGVKKCRTITNPAIMLYMQLPLYIMEPLIIPGVNQ